MCLKNISKIFAITIISLFAIFITWVSVLKISEYVRVTVIHYELYDLLINDYRKDTTLLPQWVSENGILPVDYKKLENRALMGDTTAFNRLKLIYSNWGFSDTIIDFALVMANKYNYTPAYLCVYEEIVKYNGGSIETCPQGAKRVALAYLEEYNKRKTPSLSK